MLRVQNRDVDWTQHQIVIRGVNAKDAENRRIPFDPHGRLAPILKRRASLGPFAFVFGSPEGEFQDSFKRPGNRFYWSRTDTKRSAPSPELGSSARSYGKSICTGTTFVTKARAGFSRTASTSGSSN